MIWKAKNCRAAEELMQRSLDGPLTAAERRRLDGHLATCETCRVAWEEYRRLSRTASAWMSAAAHDPGDEFTSRIMAELGLSADGMPPMPSDPPSPTRPRRWIGAAALVACASAVVVAGFFLPPIPHLNMVVDAYTPMVGSISMPRPDTLAQTWTAEPSQIADLTAAFRSWTWPVYVFAGALIGNIGFATVLGRRRGRAV